MKLDDYIEILLIKVKLSRKQMDNQLLHWLLELRTLRGQVRHLDDENKRLKQDYEKLLRQSRRLNYRSGVQVTISFLNSSFNKGTMTNKSPTMP